MATANILNTNSRTGAKLVCCLLIAIWGYAFWPTLKNVFKSYSATGYDYHGFIILPLVLILIGIQNNSSFRTQFTHSAYGIAALFFAAAIWLFANIINIPLLQQIALIGMLPAIVLLACGRKITYSIIFPLLYLFMLIPFGQPLYSKLQQIFSWLIVKSLASSGLEVYWEYNNIYVNNKEYLLTNILSSQKYITTYLCLGIIYAHLITKSIPGKIITALSFVVIPFITLFLSMYIWVISQLPNNNLPLLSWIACSISLTLCMLLGFKLRTTKTLHSVSDKIDWRTSYSKPRTNWLPAIIFSASLIFVLPMASEYLFERATSATNKSTEYNIKKQQIALHVDYINKDTLNKYYDNNIWQPLKTKRRNITLNNKTIPVTETILKNKQQTEIVWTIYYANGHLTNNLLLAKVLQNLHALTSHSYTASSITMATPVTTGLNDSRAKLQTFINELNKTSTTSWLR